MTSSANPKTRSSGSSTKFLIFATDAGRCALPIERVSETLPLPRLTPLEESQASVLGAFDLRGDLMPLVSMDIFLQQSMPIAAIDDLVIIAETARQPIAIHARRLLGLQQPRRSQMPIVEGQNNNSPVFRRIDIGESPALLIDPSHLQLAQRTGDAPPQLPDQRLSAFESGLNDAQCHLLDIRARQCSILPCHTPPGHHDSYWQVRLQGHRLAFVADGYFGFGPISDLKPDINQSASTPSQVLGCYTRSSGQNIRLSDSRRLLDLPIDTCWQPNTALLTCVNGQLEAIAVDFVEALIRPMAEPLPLLDCNHGHWLIGTLDHDHRRLPLVDLQALLHSGCLAPDTNQ
ncbi:MAG: chemotaxis protein CheW [Thiohalocapsa sp. PB-PSB1]|jgi:chemotaxis signal transduction protein|nr:MAG: chemotaxis protein CheW [Thiohalocapsa sp. PB-PSB1]HCS92830.1 hypothetical protein [Chromatiaceae bacterium]